MYLINDFLNLKKITAVFIAAFCSVISVFGAGELDTGFTASAYGTDNGTVNVVKKQPDGKVLVGGFFSAANEIAANGITRLNTDGSVDSSFNTANVFNALGIGANVTALAVLADGKIIVGGYFFSSIGENLPGIRRLNADGSLDTSFSIFNINVNNGKIFDIEIQVDDKILVGGMFTAPNSIQNIVRLNSNGTVDNTFSNTGATVKELEIQADGKILVGDGTANSGTLRRLNSNGTADGSFPTFSTNGSIEALKVKPNGQILVGGLFTNISGFALGRIALMNADGSLDLTFNQNNQGVGANPGGGIFDIELMPDERIVIGGIFLTYNGVSRKCLARLTANGLLDTSFSDNTILMNNSSIIKDLEVMPNEKVVVGTESVTTSQNDYHKSVLQFNTDGSLDSGFRPFITITGRVLKVLPQTDGKIYVGGLFPYLNGIRLNGLARLNSDGSVDTTFVPFFNDNVLRTVTAFAVQPDGKILVSLSSVSQIWRLNADGTQDTTFTNPSLGTASEIVVLANGQILVNGSNSGLRKLNSNGTTDLTFSTQVGGVNKIIVQPDGKILVGGSFTQVGTAIRGRIARLNADGTLDDTFNPPGGANDVVLDFDLQTDGKIVIGGDFTFINGSSRLRIGRLLSDGTLDNSFANQTVNGSVRAVKIQPDGKILIGGSMSYVQSTLKVGLARLNTNGTLDSSFTARPNTSVYDVELQSDGKVLIGGEFILVNDTSAVRIARLLNSVAPLRTLFDYDGDGRADVSVFRPSENRWYIFRSSDNSILEQFFGSSGDVPTPADFDGDGKTDMAIFRPSSGQWWYLSTLDGQQKSAQWGQSGDIPRPSDFDGDGRADFIVFRPSENNWYRISSSTGISSTKLFGTAGDKPVIGDFDGDGKSDVAIYRPSTGDWWWQSSVDNIQRATRWGISTDIPAPADYDGDGKTDFAVYRPSTGVWYIVNSSNGSYTIAPFGLAEDKPIPADFDGDGKADIAVFRPSTGIWYQQRTTAGFTAQQFGVSTDIPTPNAFVP